MYISPINVVTDVKTQFANDFDNECLHVVTSYGFNVNKEELAKALEYDRDQYNKGYADAEKMYRKALDKACSILEDEVVISQAIGDEVVKVFEELVKSATKNISPLKYIVKSKYSVGQINMLFAISKQNKINIPSWYFKRLYDQAAHYAINDTPRNRIIERQIDCIFDLVYCDKLNEVQAYIDKVIEEQPEGFREWKKYEENSDIRAD